MAIPVPSKFEQPILRELQNIPSGLSSADLFNGILNSQTLYGINLTQQDLLVKDPSGTQGTVRHRFQTELAYLKRKGRIIGPRNGLWCGAENQPPLPPPPRPLGVLLPTAIPHVISPVVTPPLGSNTNEQLRQRLEALAPHGFEIFVGKYLDKKGLKNIQITGRSHDGGIDGNAIETFLGIKVAFQAKKWGQGQTVGASLVRELLGSITNRGADRGLFITTASFSPGGKEESELSNGRIILIDGQQLAQDCIDMNLGIKPVTVEATIDEEFFSSLG